MKAALSYQLPIKKNFLGLDWGSSYTHPVGPGKPRKALWFLSWNHSKPSVFIGFCSRWIKPGGGHAWKVTIEILGKFELFAQPWKVRVYRVWLAQR